MLIKQQLITPEIAKELLERNTGNRPISKHQINRYARDMKAGKWRQSGDPIRFAIGGRLLDGQHRLLATIKANTPLQAVCIYDLDEATFQVIDTGKNRNAADVLAIMQIKNRAVVAAAARQQYNYEHDAFRGDTKGGSSDKPRATNQDILDVVDRHPGLIQAASKMAGYSVARGLIPGTWVVFFYYHFARINLEKAEEFFLILEGRMAVGLLHPASLLRQKVIENKLAHTKWPQRSVSALIIKAWNALVNDTKMQRLTFSKNEEFPTFE